MNVLSFKYRNAILGVTATVVGYYAILLPHTVFLKKYRYMIARYKLNKEVSIGSKVQERIQRVMVDLKLPDKVRNAIKPFSTFSFDLIHAGTLNVKYGAILGIPVNFINTADELRKNLQIMEEPIDWTRPDARTFLQAVTLSENAQKFAIAREILQIQAEEPYFNSLELALIIVILWRLYIIVPSRLHENAIARWVFYAATILLAAILWFGVKDYRSYQLDMKNDKALCSLGAEYIKGGQEFYEKLLIRNKAMRSLLGSEGKKIYTVYGNERIFLRQKHVPISERKEFFDSHLRNLEGMK